MEQTGEGLLLKLLRMKESEKINNKDIEKTINMVYPKVLHYSSRKELEKITEVMEEKYHYGSMPIFRVYVYTDSDAGNGALEGRSFRGFFCGTKKQIIEFWRHHAELMIRSRGEERAVVMIEVSLPEAVEAWAKTMWDLAGWKKIELIKFFLEAGPAIRVDEPGAKCPLCEESKSKLLISYFWRQKGYRKDEEEKYK